MSGKWLDGSKGVFAALALCVVGAWCLPAFGNDVSDWLMRVEMAPSRHNYTGAFLYEHDGQMETMRVAHRVEGDSFRQRLYSLTGSAREILRDHQSVWCFIPDQKIGVHEYRQSSRSNFLQIRGDKIAALEQYYDIRLGEVERIADHPAQVLHVTPRDDYRYGYVLWADRETGLLLRTDLKDAAGKTIERYMFVEIEIGGPIDDRLLEPRTDRDSLTWFGIDEPKEEMPSDRPMEWDSRSLPPGFTLSHSVNRLSPMDDGLIEHHVYSDGLSSVSMFVKDMEGKDGKPGLSTMGAVSAYRTMVDDFSVTVVGEVPEATVTLIAGGVTRTN